MTTSTPDKTPEISTFSGCLLQLLWSTVGPGMVLIAGLWSVLEHGPIGSPQDWFLAATTVVAVGARFLDRTKVDPSSRDAARLPHPWRYAGVVTGTAALCLVLAHFVAPLVL